MNHTETSNRWHLQTQTGQEDWHTQVSSPSPITQEEYDRYRDMQMFAEHQIRVIRVVTTTSVERTRVEPVKKPEVVR